jgi:phospholipid transport system transporter-binding protein
VAATPLKLPAAVTLAQAQDLLSQLGAAVAAAAAGGSKSLVIDASAVQSFDSSALALLLEAQREAHAAGLVCSLTNAPAKLMELARLYGVESLLGAPVAAAAAPA